MALHRHRDGPVMVTYITGMISVFFRAAAVTVAAPELTGKVTDNGKLSTGTVTAPKLSAWS